MFDRDVQLESESIIRTTGIEDFIETTITNNFIDNEDTFINFDYLEVNATTHTPKEVSVSNVQNGIYNLHTWMTNCTQNYNITYDFDIDTEGETPKLVLTITNQEPTKEMIDVKAQPISNYNEVFETDVTAKVTCLYDKVNGEDNPRTIHLVFKNQPTNYNRSDRR